MVERNKGRRRSIVSYAVRPELFSISCWLITEPEDLGLSDGVFPPVPAAHAEPATTSASVIASTPCATLCLRSVLTDTPKTDTGPA